MHTEKTPRRRKFTASSGSLRRRGFFVCVRAFVFFAYVTYNFLNGFLFHMGINSYELGHILRAIFIIKVLI